MREFNKAVHSISHHNSSWYGGALLLHSAHREVGHIALPQTMQPESMGKRQEAYPPAPGIEGLPAGYVHCSFHHPHPWGPALQTRLLASAYGPIQVHSDWQECSRLSRENSF